MNKLVYIFVFTLLLPCASFAYLDPGTGSMLVYSIVGIGVTLLYTVQSFFIKMWTSICGRKGAESLVTLDADVILHSEGPQYEHLFFPIIEELMRKKKPESIIAYITQYSRVNLPALPEGVHAFELGKGATGFAALNNVRGKVFVSTTPQLGVMMWKRSPHVQHYSHLVHAPLDIGTYRPYMLDHFDSVLCAGPFSEESIRYLEKLRGTKTKQLFFTGTVYFDAMLASKPAPVKNSRPVILIAPTWGSNGLFARWGCEFLNDIPDEFDVIVRPHPQLKISQAEIFSQVEKICAKKKFTLDTQPSGRASMEKSDLMISDSSGITFDYVFVYEKPLIIADTQFDPKGFEGFFLPKPLWEDFTRPKIGRVLRREELQSLPAVLHEELGRDKRDVLALRDECMSNFGRAVPAAAEHIQEILRAV